jgi:hypothetical protein
MPKRDFAIPDEPPEVEAPEEEEEEEGQEEEEEEEEEEETDPPSEVFAGKSRTISKARPARKKKHAPRPPEFNSKRDWPREPDLLWAHILSWLLTLTPPRHPSEVSIQVIAMGGNSYGMTVTPLEPKIRGDQVLGDAISPPGDALMNMIIDVYHARQQARSYKLKFYFPVSSKGSGWESIKESESFSLEDINTINQRRQMAANYRPAQTQGFGAAPGPQYGAPPPANYPPPMYPPPAYPQAPYYPPPPPQAYTRPYQEALEMMTGIVNELRTENAKMRGQPAPPPVQVPVPPQQPPPPSPLEQRIDALIGAIGGLVTRPVAAGVTAGLGAVGVQQPQAAVDPIEAEMRSMTTGLMRGLVKKVAGAMQGALLGEEGPVATGTETEVPAAPLTELVDPKEALPFQEVKLEGKWGNGSQVIYTPSKDGTGFGGIHVGGFLTENPFVLEKAAEIAGNGINKLGEALSDAVSRMVAGGAAHVVHRVPAGATQAGVAGAQQPPPQTVEQPPPPPPPPPVEGDPPGGWPKV